jgi:beta-phosphoglucomutase-like phosphatase (HAD superfamily)
MNTKGIIFDCDGTLADTMPLHWRAWQTIAHRYRLHFPEDRFYALGGVPTRDILAMLSREQGVLIDPFLVAREKEAEYLPLIDQIEPVIVKLFDAIVTSEDVTRQKPAPDIFLEAARRIGVPPRFCRAYEDTELGLQAIRAAGMTAVDVRKLLRQRDG